MSQTISDLLRQKDPVDSVSIRGWVRTRRDSRGFSFLEVNDGSCLRGIQVVVDAGVPGYDSISRATTGASVVVEGRLVPSQGKEQAMEVLATSLAVTGTADETYPLQKKGHSMEFLRTIAHLRPRTNLFGAVFRTRSRLAYAVHTFFQERGFVHVHTPVITASDCEGAGELFRVTTLPDNAPAPPEEDFFGKRAYLTVSGQLEGEAFACALGRIYTFGPTFRAENSNTSRHAAEFWMIEPEMAFCDLTGDIDLAEEAVRYLVTRMLNDCSEDLAFFTKFLDRQLEQRLRDLAAGPYERIPYDEAIRILQESGRKFEFPVESGKALQSEHERYLTEEYFRRPVTVFNYPAAIKPFYMRRNDDGRTVAAMDLLVPGIGEIIGGSQREERYDLLIGAMQAQGVDPADYWWYTDLRKFGTVPHAGWGMGFERLLMFVTGVSNIRDVIPFARTPGNAEF